MKTQCERSPQDQIDIEFDPFAEFDVCAASYTPIYNGSPSIACPFDGAKYHPQYKKAVLPRLRRVRDRRPGQRPEALRAAVVGFLTTEGEWMTSRSSRAVF